MAGLMHMLINPFVGATKGSFTHTATLGAYTNAALESHSSDQALAALYRAYHPVWLVYDAAHTKAFSDKGTRMSKVLGLKQGMNELSEKIKDWALRIEAAYGKTSPQYIELLPRGRSPFRVGSYTDRVSHVATLAAALAGHASLGSLKTEVIAFRDHIEALLQEASGSSSISKGDGISLEKERLALCTALYAVLGGLIALYPNDPERTKAFFDIATMHRHRKRKVKTNNIT